MLDEKLNNFDKVGKTKTAWSVTKSTECDLGKWLLSQENKGETFTKTENWKLLKINHDSVHNCVQDYINEDCKTIADKYTLNNLSQKLDSSTIEVFKCLDQIKKDNIVKKTVQEVNFEQKISSTPNLSVPKSFEQSKPKSSHTTANNQKSTIITSSSKDDDEWESF